MGQEEKRENTTASGSSEYKFSDGQGANTPGSVRQSSKSKDKKALRAIIIGFLITLAIGIALFVGIFVFVSSATEESKEVSDEFLQSLIDGECDRAFNLTSDEFKQSVSETEWQQLCTASDEYLVSITNNTGREIAHEDGVSAASITYEVDGVDVPTYNIQIDLVKQDGNWRVIYYNSVAAQ